MITLMQRLTRYDILFKDYERCLPDDHPDKSYAKRALR